MPELSVPAASAPRRRPGPLAVGSGAQLLLIDAAEELFALNGVEAVSLRAISAAAGLTSASLHYHFRSRDELLRAILARRTEGLLDRLAFNELESGRRSLSVVSLVRTVFDPWVYLVREEPDRGPLFLRLYSQLLAVRDRRVQETLGPVTAQFRRLFSRLPEPASSSLRWAIAIDCLIHELAAIAEMKLEEEAFDQHTAALVDFVVGGLMAGPTTG